MGRSVRARKEKQIEKKVCDRALRELGVPNIGLKLLLGGHNGWPDRGFLIGENRILLVEFKDPEEGEVSAIQSYIHDMLKGLGYDVEVHDNEDEAFEAVRAAKLAQGRSLLPKARQKGPDGQRRRNRAAGPRPR